MTPRSYNGSQKSNRGFFLVIGLIVCAVLVVAICLGLNVSAAGAGSTNASTFGLTETSEPHGSTNDALQDVSLDAGENSVLTKSTSRNIDKAVDEMLAIEEAERRAEEEARLAAEAAKQAEIDALQAAAVEEAALVGLEPVDWSIGHDAFVAQWSARIDAYLEGYPLAGQGATFAEAAWEYGVDPRWSPAISNTESTRGLNCSVSFNAWGWGPHIPFASWEQGINTHVAGLKNGYGTTISMGAAQKYCPPTYQSWFSTTVSQMALI